MELDDQFWDYGLGYFYCLFIQWDYIFSVEGDPNGIVRKEK